MGTEIMTDELSQAMPAGKMAPSGTLPPLENGDRLSRSDFEQRYDAMPHVKKAELIEGIVYMPSPVRVRSHGKPHGQIMGWISLYSAATPGVDFADNTTLRLDPDNAPQPDAMLWIDAAAGGHARISEDDYLEGSPELIVEVAASSASYDLHVKREVYRRNGVQEYIVWRVYDRHVDWFRLANGQYVTVPADAAGLIHSRVFPGLWLAVPALLSGDLAYVLAEVQKGLASAEHQAFVETLAAAVHTKP
jgi:Uma2 family endonuclease